MYDLFWIGSGDDEIVENADWVEINTLFRHDQSISRDDLARAIHQARDIKEEKARMLAEDIFTELEDRSRSCGDAEPSSIASYPFELSEDNYALRKKLVSQRRTDTGLLYLFLLTVTRADMSSRQRTFAGLDPTRLFERLCADILIQFWGGKSPFSNVMDLGTAGTIKGKHRFQSKIEDLCNNLREGGGWKPNARSPKAGDGKVDLVVWRRFNDNRQGGLVGLTQCKTGFHWRNDLGKLKPDSFCRKYMRNPLLIKPISIYMVPCRINYARWEDDTCDGGLLFDRCRITQYGSTLSEQIMKDCRTWLNAVINKHKKPS